MTTPTIDLADARSRIEEIERAARDLEQGGLVAIPTDTVFALAADASSEQATDRLWSALPDRATRSALAWHLPAGQRIIDALHIEAPLHRRLITRLCPGQVTFAIPALEQTLEHLRNELGIAPGVFDDGHELLARVPAHACALTLLEKTDRPVVMAALPGAETARPRTADEAADTLRNAGAFEHVARIIADEHPPLARRSTLVRLTDDGSFTVARKGACEERFIRRAVTRTVLFLCSGNTCRSPMAQAIAQHLFDQNAADVPTEAASAGTFAGHGSPPTDEARRAVESLGIAMPAITSRPLTREMLEQADLVLCMTDAHANAARAMLPGAAPRIALLDPGGRDIPDPIGHPQSVYDEAARHIRDAIESRLPEIATL